MGRTMSSYVWLVAAVAGVSFLAYRAGRIWVDAGRRGLGLVRRLGWALLGAAAPSRYWWGARIGVLSPQERAGLLAHETQALGLRRAGGLRCPLCGAEVPHAWALTRDGRPTVAPGPVQCPRCDFRLDACRHCAHFLPGGAQGQDLFVWSAPDATFGRCNCYKVVQPVEQTCAPEIARRLKARGWEHIRAPLPIVDSFVPPDSCTAFSPDRKRLRAAGIRWPNPRRVALLRMLALPPARETESPEGLPSDDEQWLL